jgi:quinolinate synthase
LRVVDELQSQYSEFIIGTEKGLIYRLQKLHPELQFFLPSPLIVCPTMKRNRLEQVVNCMENRAPEITVPEDIRVRALRAVEAMLAVK